MNNPVKVDFATTVYEKDWELILKTNRLRNVVKTSRYSFNKRVLYINNVSNYNKVISYAQKHIDEDIIDEFVLVKEYEQEVREYFCLEDENGYYYLIQLLTMIYLTRSPYIVVFTGDTIMLNSETWINDAINTLRKNPRIVSCGPQKERHLKHILRDTIFDDEHFYYSRVFTDQCFLADVEKFKKMNFNQKSQISMYYPEKSKGAFEERVFCYLYNNDFYIGKSKRAVYRNKNFPRTAFGRWLCLYLGYKNRKFFLKKHPTLDQ